MDDDYEDEANADLTLGIISKAHGRSRSHLALSPKTQAFFAAEEDRPLEIIELTSGAEEEVEEQDPSVDPSVEIISDMPAIPKRRKVNSRDYISDAPDRERKKSKKTKKKAKGKIRKQDVTETEPSPNEEEEAVVQEEARPVRKPAARAPRYFDPPEAALTCYNCGEPGHFAVECTAERPRKPCYVCGSLSHKGNNCTLMQDGPDNATLLCILCGDVGHLRNACRKKYTPDDLKAVQCYVCKQLGHLCCVDGLDSFPRHPSCYRCGFTGHTGTACPRSPPAPATEAALNREEGASRRKVKPKSSSGATKIECFKCGGKGHYARECREYNEPQCYNCGLQGHIARECNQGRLPADDGRGMRLPRWTEMQTKTDNLNLDHNQQRRFQRAGRLPKWYSVEGRPR